LIVKEVILFMQTTLESIPWKQPVLNNEGKNSWSSKQWEPLMGLRL